MMACCMLLMSFCGREIEFSSIYKNKGAGLHGYIVYLWNPAPFLLFFILGDTLLASGVSLLLFSLSWGYDLASGVSLCSALTCLGICFWLLAYPLFGFSLPGGYTLDFWRIPFALFFVLGIHSWLVVYLFFLISLPGDTSLYPYVLSQLAWGYALVSCCIPFWLFFVRRICF